MSQWLRATVNVDYHVAFDGNFYSAPYSLVQQIVEVRATPWSARRILYQFELSEMLV
jgi:hypothetical protein